VGVGENVVDGVDEYEDGDECVLMIEVDDNV